MPSPAKSDHQSFASLKDLSSILVVGRSFGKGLEVLLSTVIGELLKFRVKT